jgi:hypothetical protein
MGPDSKTNFAQIGGLLKKVLKTIMAVAALYKGSNPY